METYIHQGPRPERRALEGQHPPTTTPQKRERSPENVAAETRFGDGSDACRGADPRADKAAGQGWGGSSRQCGSNKGFTQTTEVCVIHHMGVRRKQSGLDGILAHHQVHSYGEQRLYPQQGGGSGSQVNQMGMGQDAMPFLATCQGRLPSAQSEP